MTKNLDMEYLLGAAGIFAKEITKMIVEMDMDKCIGQMVVITKVSGRMEFNMELGKYSYPKKV